MTGHRSICNYYLLPLPLHISLAFVSTKQSEQLGALLKVLLLEKFPMTILLQGMAQKGTVEPQLPTFGFWLHNMQNHLCTRPESSLLLYELTIRGPSGLTYSLGKRSQCSRAGSVGSGATSSCNLLMSPEPA